jgi:hypothetical protein
MKHGVADGKKAFAERLGRLRVWPWLVKSSTFRRDPAADTLQEQREVIYDSILG